jgi:2-amino-4-hydroxy-6-hydroxymethyldihydropteridine diphosphokinase
MPSEQAATVSPHRLYIGLGANLGNSRATLDAACAELAALPACRWVARSSHYRSAPVDTHGPDFLNAVVALDCSLDTGDGPLRVLHALQSIERGHGRERPYRYAPRTLDLDLLLYGRVVLNTSELTLPHPRLHQRAFVLRPLLELAPDLVLPGIGAARDCLPALAEQTIERLA